LAAPDAAEVAPAAARPVLLEARGIRFGYDHQPVLDDVSLSVEAGEFVALVGPNGSGKSTLLRILLGSLKPERGEVRIFGTDPDDFEQRARLGYVPQRPTLASEVPATVREIVTSGRLSRRGWWRALASADREAVDHAIESVGLAGLANRPVTTLSGGQQQRAFIARAFASEPDLLVLDEPVAGIDAESQRRFSDSLTHLIREHHAGVLLVSHELSAVAGIVDRVIVLKGRVLFDGTPTALMREGVSLGIHPEDLPLWLEGLR
jgi:zinc transport system ATP-binding protein